MQILIVEDEKRLADVLGQLCREQRWQADVVYTGTDGLEYARSGQYDAVVLDVMLPGLDGFGVVRTMRRENIATPVLMLTARDDVRDKVTGLDCGADDYMLTLDLTNYELRCGERRVRLGFKEFEVLRLLLEHPGMVVPKETLLTRVWGAESDAEDNNAEAYISFLRKKLHFLGSRVGIATLRKVGYRLEVSA